MTPDMMRTPLLALLALLALGPHCLPVTEAWVSHRSSLQTSPLKTWTKSRVSWSHPQHNRGKILSVRESDSLPDSSTDSSSKSWSGKFMLVSLGLVALLLLPLRATASTLAEPSASTLQVAAGVAPAILTPEPFATLTVGPPVSAAAEVQLMFRLVYAAIMGAALGKERSFAKHSAGVRTMALVAMGASAFTVCSAYGFAHIGRYDPSRMASNVASGVGFVGAGVITTSANNKQNVVHGLTTAATIWLSAAVGVACGVGLFRVATTAAITTVLILRLGRVKPKHRRPSTKVPVTLLETEHSKAEDFVESDYDGEDDTEDQFAETHDSTLWDVQKKESSPKAKPIPRYELPTSRRSVPENIVIPEHDAEMEELVRNAWENSTHFIHHETLEHFTPKRTRSDHRP